MAVRDLWHKKLPDGTRVRSDRYGRGMRWEVSYRDDDGRNCTKRFPLRPDAVDFDARQKAAWARRVTVPRGWA